MIVPHEEEPGFPAGCTASEAKTDQNNHRTSVEFIKELHSLTGVATRVFLPQNQTIHINEKWFQKEETGLQAVLVDNKEAKAKSLQFKGHIANVILPCDVACA
jgi:hypothetical protein